MKGSMVKASFKLVGASALTLPLTSVGVAEPVGHE